jgi:hypothetical protein
MRYRNAAGKTPNTGGSRKTTHHRVDNEKFRHVVGNGDFQQPAIYQFRLSARNMA